MQENRWYITFNRKQGMFHAEDQSPSAPHHGWELLAVDTEERVFRFLDWPNRKRIFSMSTAVAKGFYMEWQRNHPIAVKGCDYKQRDTRRSRKQTWIYLMRDLRGDFTKIGESVSPRFRETTLQAEQPLIDLVQAWEGTASDEAYLHHFFADKRVRGEWFTLTWEDYVWIERYFADRRKFTGYSTGYEHSMDHEHLRADNAGAVDFIHEALGYEF